MNIPIFNTFVDPSASNVVKEVLESTFLSEGQKVLEFETQLTNQFGILNPVALNSGTSALHLALVVAGVVEGDEVIIPAQTFVATGLVVLQQGAIPVFADIDYNTGNISVQSIREKLTSKTKAIIPVHWGGYPCDLEEIIRIAKENNLTVIEDAAHALGASYRSAPIGSISDFTCFSFQAIKHLTTGDGGALACLNTDHKKQAYVKRWFGIDRANASPSILGERLYNIPELGYKYHMNDYSAALGLANMNNFFHRLNRRIEYAGMYVDALSKVDGVTLFKNEPDRQSAYWLFGMHVEDRVRFIEALRAKGITASVIHQRIDRNSIFGGIRKDLPNQEEFDRTQVHIPIHDGLNNEKICYIIDVIKGGW